jgi:hypothetical protein
MGNVRVVLLWLLAGCSHNKDASALGPDLGGSMVTVETVDGRTVEAKVSWDENGKLVLMSDGEPIDESGVNRVVGKSRSRGAASGVLFGVFVGGASGAVVGYSGGDDPPCSFVCISHFTAQQKALLAGIAGVGFGAIAGAIIGAIVGGQEVYEFRTEAVRVRPVGPSGSVAGLTVAW